jgi:predicted aspartyl protease
MLRRLAWAPLILVGLLPVAGCVSAVLWATRIASPIDWNRQDRIELQLRFDSIGRPGTIVSVASQDVLAICDSGSALSLIGRATANASGALVKSAGSGKDSVEDVLVRFGPGSIKSPLVGVSDELGDIGFLFGQQLFSQAVVDMDFAASRLTLINPDAFVPPRMDPVSVKLIYSRPTIQLRVNESKSEICAVIDTGFNSGVALTPKLATDLALPTIPGQSAILLGLDGTPTKVRALVPLHEVQFGERISHAVPVFGGVPNDTIRCPNLLGMSILSGYHVIFDLKKPRIWLLPFTGEAN